MRLSRFQCGAALAAVGCVALILCGCGMPGAPLPPSLNLPDRVTDLSASRAGDQVSLTWTMPKRNTDKLLLEGNVHVRVCRRENTTGACLPVTSMDLAPGGEGSFAETLPRPLSTGEPRLLTYFVELVNRKGRSAGLSNGVDVPAGSAPAAVSDLSAEMREDGVLLRWAPATPEAEPTTIRLQRKLLTPAKPAARAAQNPFAPAAEPIERALLVPPEGRRGAVIDKDIHFGESYEYRAQRMVAVTVSGKKLELAGPLSAPVRISAEDIFPPDAPAGLAAVATPGANGTPPAVDLSWQPNTEANLAGYAVYRREADSAWQRISPAQPVTVPGYHDPNVQPGHTYLYTVSAVDQNGHESARSAEAQETVPGP